MYDNEEFRCDICGIQFDVWERNDGAYVQTLCPACVEDADADAQAATVSGHWQSLPTVRDALDALAESKEV